MDKATTNVANIEMQTSKDEVDFVVVANNNNNNNNINKINNNNNNINYDIKQTNNKSKTNDEKVPTTTTTTTATTNTLNNKQQVKNQSILKIKKMKPNLEANTEHKKSTKERLSLFSFSKKISQKSAAPQVKPTTVTTNQTNTATTAAAIPVAPSNAASRAEQQTEAEAEQETEAEDEADAEENSSSTFTLPCAAPFVPIGTPPRQHKFVKSSSISRLLGNTYNAKKFERDELKRNNGKFNTYSGRRRASGPYLERFKRYSKEDGDVAANNDITVGGVTLTTDSRDLYGGSRNELVGVNNYHNVEHHEDLGHKALRTLSRSLGKLWWKRRHSVEISTPDPEFKVSYLGNVLTGWAKGEGCVEKQLNTLWRNYTQNSKPDVVMRIKVCASGLKATTRQHGLTEYWANRITHCCAPTNYPRVFCWIYRHEGRKLKHELRCHAVLCGKEKIAQDMCDMLKDNLECALREFKREKILKQNARLSLANSAYDNPSLPRRKILLSVGGNNYRPPLERSKSAPKLMAIEEAIGEEEGEEIEETNEPEMKSCCQKDSLYPAMTLGRRRCRRGHSIRRTGKARPCLMEHDETCCNARRDTKETAVFNNASAVAAAAGAADNAEAAQRNSYGSDDSDDFDKLLKHNNYDATASLSNELLPYFDMKLHKNTSNSLGSLTELKDYEEPLSLSPTINSDPSADPDADYHPIDAHDDDDEMEMVGLRRNGVCSDGEEDYLEADDMYFRQTSILNILHRESMRKMANLSLSSDESSSIETNGSAPVNYRHQMQSSISSNASSTATSASASALESNSIGSGTSDSGAITRKQLNNPDSDEGSISSGCETASTVTANQDDLSLNYRQSKQLHDTDYATLSENMPSCNDKHGEEPITAEEIYQRLESRLQKRHNSDATTFSSSSSITLKMSPSPTASTNGLDSSTNGVSSFSRNRRTRRQSNQREQHNTNDTDSECSDESGYVEFQEKERQNVRESSAASQLKPQPPPKPMPRRFINASVNSTSTAV